MIRTIDLLTSSRWCRRPSDSAQSYRNVHGDVAISAKASPPITEREIDFRLLRRARVPRLGDARRPHRISSFGAQPRQDLRRAGTT